MGKKVLPFEELQAFIEANAEECPDQQPPPVAVIKTLEGRFDPKWRQYSSQPGTEIDVTSGVDFCELYTEPVDDRVGLIDTLVTLKVKVDAQSFTVHTNSRYSIELPPAYEWAWPLDGLDVGVAQFWYPGGRNMFPGNCFWTNRDNTPWHLIFAFAGHGEWEKNHPVDLGVVSEFKLRGEIAYGIRLEG
jgi:hypothetical protein